MVTNAAISRMPRSLSEMLVQRAVAIRNRLSGHMLRRSSAGWYCPVCAARGASRPVATNVLRNGAVVPVYECTRCSHKFVHPVPSAEELLGWYQGTEYHAADRAYQGIHSLALTEQWAGYISARMAPLEQDILQRFSISGSLRIGEIGCGEGALLKHLALSGHQVIGFEAGEQIAAQGVEAYGIDIVSGDFESMQLPWRDLDVIMSFHTFEHLRQPARVVSRAAAMLRQHGAILIEVPCDDREMNNPDHLHFFSERSLTRLLRDHFDALKLRPNTYLRDGVAMTGSMFISGRKI